MELNDHRIKERAFQLWQDAGSPQGADLEHWFRAEKEFTINEMEEPPSELRGEKASNSRASSVDSVPDSIAG